MAPTRQWVYGYNNLVDDVTSVIQHDTGNLGTDVWNFPVLHTDLSILRSYGSVEVFAQVVTHTSPPVMPVNWHQNIEFWFGLVVLQDPFTDPDPSAPYLTDWLEWDGMIAEQQLFDPTNGFNTARWTLPQREFDSKAQRRLSAGNSYTIRGIFGWFDPLHYLTRGYVPEWDVYVGYQYSAAVLTQSYT